MIMSMHPRMEEFGPAPSPQSVEMGRWQRFLVYLKIVFSGAKGDQGGWESGARGL